MVELRLRLRVPWGRSLVEEEHERGVAHFVEHKAFKGTTSFPGNGELIKAMERIGEQKEIKNKAMSL